MISSLSDCQKCIFFQFHFAEYGFSHDEYDPPKTLTNFIAAIRRKSKEENLKCKWLILLDEVVIYKGKSDFSTLNLDDDDDNIELVVAVNPGGIGDTYTIIPPHDKKFITKRFTFKHRNSLEISVFLAHLKKFAKGNDYPIDENEDKELTKSCFPAIDKVFLSLFQSFISYINDMSNICYF